MFLKAFIYLIFGISSLGMISEGIAVSALKWGDLPFVEQFRILFGSFLILTSIAVGAITFTNIWVRDGYSGEDGILVDKEVALYISHVLAFMAFIFFCFLALFHKYNQPPDLVYWIDALVFLNPGAIRVVQRIMDKFNKPGNKVE